MEKIIKFLGLEDININEIVEKTSIEKAREQRKAVYEKSGREFTEGKLFRLDSLILCLRRTDRLKRRIFSNLILEPEKLLRGKSASPLKLSKFTSKINQTEHYLFFQVILKRIKFLIFFLEDGKRGENVMGWSIHKIP